MIWCRPCVLTNFFFCVFHLYLHLAILHLPFQPITVQSIAFRKNLIYQFRNVSHYITSNCIRIDKQYSPHPVSMSFWLWQSPIICQAHLDTLHTMLIGHTTFSGFPHPTFHQWHWSPYNVDFNNSLIHGSRFRKEVISHQFVMSKSLIFMSDFSTYMYQCILMDYNMIFNLCKVSIYLWSCFVKLSSHLRET